MIPDDDLIASFEELRLPKAEWTHQTHVRVAYLYVRDLPFETALNKIRTGILALNESHGVVNGPDSGYHETVTVAFARLIAAASAQWPNAMSTEFCDQNPNLMEKRVLLNYYSRDVINGREARAEFVEPDVNELTVCAPEGMK